MGVIICKGFDVGEVPPTPAQPIFDALQVVPKAYSNLIDCGREFGTPISYIQEQDGNLVQNILPVHKTEYKQISTSSKVELELHTETAFHPYKPSHLFLFCLRGDDSAVTTYANSEDFLSELSEETLETLQQPLFKTRIDESFRTDGSPDLEILMPILRKMDTGFDVTYDRNFMTGITPDAEVALRNISWAISSCLREIVLETGDLLIINNGRTVHGRKPFQARYDGTDRWVLRLLTIKNIPVASHRKGHVITTQFGKTSIPSR